MTPDEWSAKRDEAWDTLQKANRRLRDETERLGYWARAAEIHLQFCEDGFRKARDREAERLPIAERGGSAQTASAVNDEKGDTHDQENFGERYRRAWNDGGR